MSLFYRLLVGPNGPDYTPLSSPTIGGNPNLAGVVSRNQQTASPTPLAAPFGPPPGPYEEIPLLSQAFGALPTGFGLAVKDGVVQVDSSALTGNLNGGSY